MSKWERDLGPWIRFLNGVIERLKETDPKFSIYTDGPWHGFGPIWMRHFKRKTGGLPRGVAVKWETIYILFLPTMFDGVPLDPNRLPMCQIKEMERDFKQSSALMLHQVHKLAGESWRNAWEEVKATWEAKGREVPSFEEFLQED